MTTTRVSVGQLTNCIQVGHYGPHPAAADCLVIDDHGRCRRPAQGPPANPCGHPYEAGSPLLCTRTDPHEPGHGCTYAASSGSHTEAEPY